MAWRGDTTFNDRLFASLAYLLVLYDGAWFSGSLLTVFPQLNWVLEPLLLPLIEIHKIIPFASLIIFFGLFFLVVRNEKIKHFIRFNIMQALLITIILFLAQLILGFLSGIVLLALVFKVLSTLIFMGVLVVVAYAIIQSFRGEYADLPSISEAVYMQVP